jgi:hypothetical protein
MDPFPVQRVAHIRPAPPADDWLIQRLWAWPAVGFIAGTPKSGKTFLALELAVAVASGRPAFGRFLVHKQGPVLVYAAEDEAAAVRRRVAGICQARGIDLERLAVGLITEPALRLDRDQHRQRLQSTIAHIRPRLLVLDPLVRLHRADENSSAEISELLGFLRDLQREHQVAIALVHHIRKSPAGQPGQALRGSGDLHAWTDSALYLLRDKGQLALHAEHRSQAAPAPLAVSLEQDPARLEVAGSIEDEGEDGDDQLAERVVEALRREPMTRTRLRNELRVRNERLGASLEALARDGRIERGDGVWAVPVPRP